MYGKYRRPSASAIRSRANVTCCGTAPAVQVRAFGSAVNELHDARDNPPTSNGAQNPMWLPAKTCRSRVAPASAASRRPSPVPPVRSFSGWSREQALSLQPTETCSGEELKGLRHNPTLWRGTSVERVASAGDACRGCLRFC